MQEIADQKTLRTFRI